MLTISLDRHGHLMLYDDANQVEVRYVISLAHHDVSIYGGEGEILEGELWLKRNAICLSRRLDSLGDLGGPTPPFYLFSDNLTEKEDFYFAMLQNQTRMGDSPNCPPKHQQFDVKHIVTLVQRLHSSEEQLQTRWINAVLGRLFLALYKTPEVEDFIRQKITKKISRVNKPNFISKLCLQRIDMGEGAPFITNPRLKDLTVDGNCCVETDIQYTGNFRLEISATVRIDLGPRFKAREVDIVLAVVLKKLEGHMLIRFKPPPSNRVWVSFETMPNMVMDIEPIVSSKQITYGIILRTIESRIREVVAESVVQPYWDDIPFLDTASQPYRGGIWQREVPGQDSKAEIPDESISQPQTLTTKDSTEALKTKDDRAMSMPVLLETTAGLKSRKSSKLVTTDSETSISSAVDKTGGLSPPRAIRSQTFSNVADPVVTADNVKIEKATSDIKGEEKSSAASAMIEISNRSPPGSPNKTPNGSPPSISQMNPEKLSSSRGSSFMESIESVSEFASSSPTRPTSAHLASESSNALRGANGSSNASINSDRSRRRSTLETVGTLTRSSRLRLLPKRSQNYLSRWVQRPRQQKNGVGVCLEREIQIARKFLGLQALPTSRSDVVTLFLRQAPPYRALINSVSRVTLFLDGSLCPRHSPGVPKVTRSGPSQSRPCQNGSLQRDRRVTKAVPTNCSWLRRHTIRRPIARRLIPLLR